MKSGPALTTKATELWVNGLKGGIDLRMQMVNHPLDEIRRKGLKDEANHVQGLKCRREGGGGRVRVSDSVQHGNGRDILETIGIS